MKTKDEHNALNEEADTLNRKLAGMSEMALEQVMGGSDCITGKRSCLPSVSEPAVPKSLASERPPAAPPFVVDPDAETHVYSAQTPAGSSIELPGGGATQNVLGLIR